MHFLLSALGIVGGLAEAPVCFCNEPLSIARIDSATGVMHERGHALDGVALGGTVLVFPAGKGSSGGSYNLLNLAALGKAPAAIVAGDGDAVVIAGAMLAGIPMVAGFDAAELSRLGRAARLRVDGLAGTVEST